MLAWRGQVRYLEDVLSLEKMLIIFPEYGLDNRLQTNMNPTTGQLLRFGHIEDMKECLREHHSKTAAIIIESIRNTGKSVPHEYLDYVQQLTQTYQYLRRRGQTTHVGSMTFAKSMGSCSLPMR